MEGADAAASVHANPGCRQRRKSEGFGLRDDGTRERMCGAFLERPRDMQQIARRVSGLRHRRNDDRRARRQRSRLVDDELIDFLGTLE